MFCSSWITLYINKRWNWFLPLYVFRWGRTEEGQKGASIFHVWANGGSRLLPAQKPEQWWPCQGRPGEKTKKQTSYILKGIKITQGLFAHRNKPLHLHCLLLLLSLQAAPKAPVKVPPPVPTKPKGPGVMPHTKHGLNTGTFPKAKPHSQQPHVAQGRSPLPPSQSQTLPLPSKQDTPPAATVRPFTPELPSSKDSSLSKPQTLAASSIYSMYTQQPGTGKPFQTGVQAALNRSQNRNNGFVSGKIMQFSFYLMN